MSGSLPTVTTAPTPIPTARVVVAGLAAGALSGLFGIGGGIVMVPLFVLWLGLPQKIAITTSLLAIIPISIAAIAGYATGDAVAWQVGLIIGLGSVVGGQIGVRLLPVIPVPYLQIAFAVLLLYSAFRLVQPATTGPTADNIAGWPVLVLVGVVAGIVAALLGVGGGIIVVPALVLLAGVDLTTARGTSLLVVLLTAVTASLTNWRAGSLDIRVGWVTGLAGIPASLGAALIAQSIPQQAAAYLFAALMVVAALQLLRRAWLGRQSRRGDSNP